MITFLFKGILRDKSRFLFPFLIVTFGVALVISLVGFMEGTMMGMIDNTANLDTGHLRLVNKPFYLLHNHPQVSHLHYHLIDIHEY